MMKVSGGGISYFSHQRRRVPTVENKHDGCEVEGPLLVPENHLTEIAYIADLGVLHAEFPEKLNGETAGGVRDTYQVIKDV
jgi:hypothetical protein